jgi:hypothetical protein
MSEQDCVPERAAIKWLEGQLDIARADNERLRAALKECADDLEAELNGRYEKTLDYPSQRARYDRDMVPVVEARKLLAN